MKIVLCVNTYKYPPATAVSPSTMPVTACARRDRDAVPAPSDAPRSSHNTSVPAVTAAGSSPRNNATTHASGNRPHHNIPVPASAASPIHALSSPSHGDQLRARSDAGGIRHIHHNTPATSAAEATTRSVTFSPGLMRGSSHRRRHSPRYSASDVHVSRTRTALSIGSLGLIRSNSHFASSSAVGFSSPSISLSSR